MYTPFSLRGTGYFQDGVHNVCHDLTMTTPQQLFNLEREFNFLVSKARSRGQGIQ